MSGVACSGSCCLACRPGTKVQHPWLSPDRVCFLQVSYGTWFGANTEFIHGIQVGTLTAASHADGVCGI
jgi:endoglucanase Acf2